MLLNIKTLWIHLVVLALLVSPSLTTAIQAQSDLGLPGIKSKSLDQILGKTETVAAEPELKSHLKAVSGHDYLLELQLTLPAGGYTYSMVPVKNFGGQTRVEITKIEGLKPAQDDFTPDHPPRIHNSPEFNAELQEYDNAVTWTQKLTRENGTSSASMAGKLILSVCNAETCKPYELAFNAVAPATDSPAMVETAAPANASSQVIIPAVLSPTFILMPVRDEAKGTKTDPVTFKFGTYRTEKGEVQVQIEASLKEHWHLYAQNQDPEMAGTPTIITVTNHEGLDAIAPNWVPDRAAKIEKPLDDIIQHVFHDKVTWSSTYKPTTGSTAIRVAGKIQYQLCDEHKCLSPHTVSFEVGGNISDLPMLIAETKTAQTSTAVENPKTESSSSGDLSAVSSGQALSTSPQFVQFMIAAVLAGFGALLTPCVFPMVPITVSVFLKQSERKGHKPLTMASVFCLGIIGGFTILGVLISVVYGSSALTSVANNAWLNIFFAGVLVFFGCSMLGMFELIVPSWLLSWSSNQENRNGFIGILFMALTFTLVSFTCTFAFVGTLLVWAANGQYFWPVLGMLGFSSAFASPFFFLALFPSYLKTLPKSGGWMNTVKVTLGIVELGAAFKFLSVADLQFNAQPYFFDYTFVMSVWMILCLITGMYLLGQFRLPHDSPTDKVPATQFVVALVFMTLGAYLAAGIFAPKKPRGIIWEQIEAFAPPVFETVSPSSNHGLSQSSSHDTLASYKGPVVAHGDDGLSFAVDFQQAVKVANQTQQPMFIDFTGVNCVNCRKMEKTIFPTARNHELLSQLIRVQLYTDTDAVPGTTSREVGKELRTQNLKLQQDWFQDVTLPAYAVVAPDGKTILSVLSGYQPGEGVFTKFLEDGIMKWREQQARVPSPDTMK